MAVTFDPEEYKRTTRQQWEHAAEAWHRWGPTLEAWLGGATERMLRAAGVGQGSRVLDVAAGAVISRLGLICFPDQQRALAGMRRALRTGGRLSAVVYSTADSNELFSVPLRIICRRAQLPPPLPRGPGPFGLGRPGVIEKAFGLAGFGDIRVTPVSAPLRMPSAAVCARFERDSFRALDPMLAGVAEGKRGHLGRDRTGAGALRDAHRLRGDRANFSSHPVSSDRR